jgi:hypothetical protein
VCSIKSNYIKYHNFPYMLYNMIVS